MCHVNEQGNNELKQVLNQIVLNSLNLNKLSLTKSKPIIQIEVNNIAVSMGGLAQRATLLHQRLLKKVGSPKLVPDNQPITTLAEGIHIAW